MEEEGEEKEEDQQQQEQQEYLTHQLSNEENTLLLHIMCGYQCDKAVNKNDTREVI